MGNCMPNKQCIYAHSNVTKKFSTQSVNHYKNRVISIKDLRSSSKGNVKEKVNKLSVSRIPESSWIKVFDYFQFNEVREMGKVNRLFNQTAKSSVILVKFFKKKSDTNYLNSTTSASYSANVSTPLLQAKRDSLFSFGEMV